MTKYERNELVQELETSLYDIQETALSRLTPLETGQPGSVNRKIYLIDANAADAAYNLIGRENIQHIIHDPTTPQRTVRDLSVSLELSTGVSRINN
ncbi:hypothetical protein HY469_01250 [Candidatus Roizmanbacteria bacterium]|nr:hypothetical protein [Candidatus Roizmanbacteria bacterium]